MCAAHDASVRDEDAAARAMIGKVNEAVRPVMDRMIEGEYTLIPGAAVSLDEVRTAIFLATGSWVRDVVLVRNADVLNAARRRVYARTLERGLGLMFGLKIMVGLGSRRWARHRSHFGYGQTLPFEAYLSVSSGLIPWESLRSALFHFWGLALSRQDHLLDRMVPLIGLITKAIPLGELVDRPGVWEVMVA